MLGKLHQLLSELIEVAKPLGFKLDRESDWTAALVRADGAQLSLDSDKLSSPAFTLEVCPPDTKNHYGVWLLMKIYEPTTPPTWANQLAFIQRWADKLFTNEVEYQTEYERLNLAI